MCDNHPTELSYRYGHIQAQVHRTALQAVCIKGQLPYGYGTFAMSISLCHMNYFSVTTGENLHMTEAGKGFCAVKITHLTCFLFQN